MSLQSTLILVRHGESLANREGRFTRHDDEPLTATGVEQARETGRRLRDLYAPVALYSSPFARALHTAHEIGAFFGLEPEVERELHEQGFGELRGRTYVEYYPAVAAVAELDRWHHRAPGGESLADVRRRVGPVLDRIAGRHGGQQVIVVSHGGVMAALRAHAAGNFDRPPESTVHAGGFLLHATASGGYRGPLPLFREAAAALDRAAAAE
ncbi:MAG TPA: histidine phosphatase family protein [Thermoanaerobaculia bacterium]|nr:histidine phosphatase family protein [Thermoanaerobaculia bacterium]